VTQSVSDLLLFVYIAIGAILHFLVVVEALFPKRSLLVDSLAGFGLAYGFLWILIVLTWPIWIVALTIDWMSKK
jgi:hypothetical protein